MRKDIDVERLIRQKYKGYIPHFVFKWLERLIHQDKLNELNNLDYGDDGVESAKILLDHMNITMELIGEENLQKKGKRYLFVGNHPLGGADGIILTYLLGSHYRGKIKVLVNDLLINLRQFRSVFVPINKYGAQGRERMSLLNEALEGEDQVFTFPAGLCSRMNDNNVVCDLEWKTSFIRMAQRSNRDVVPIYFEGENSKRFYRWAKRREKLGIKFNYELILLPDELIKAKGKHFKVYIGKPIPVEELPSGSDMRTFTDNLRDSIYDIPKLYK